MAAATTSTAPKVGQLVTDGTRVGLLIATDRPRPNGKDPGKGEAAEPLVAWLEPAPFGGELTALP